MLFRLSIPPSADNQPRAVEAADSPFTVALAGKMIYFIAFFKKNLISLSNITWTWEAREKIVSYKFHRTKSLDFQLRTDLTQERAREEVATFQVQGSSGKA